MSESQAAAAWAEILEPDELAGIVYALGIFEKAGQVTADDARAWRRAILARHRLPVGRGQA